MPENKNIFDRLFRSFLYLAGTIFFIYGILVLLIIGPYRIFNFFYLASGIILLVAMMAVFYFLLIRPENKKTKKAEEMRNNLSVGDKITTIGGFVGKIVDISGDLVTFETGEDRVRLQVAKWGISMNSIDKSGESK